MPKMYLSWNIILNTASSLRLMEYFRSYFNCLMIRNLNEVFSRSITALPGGPVDAVVEKAAKRLGITPTQVLLLWAKAKGAVIVTFVILNTEFSIPDV